MRDYKITVEEFFDNNGFSGKHFVEHIKHLAAYIQSHTNIQFTLYRYKIVIKNKNNNKEITVRPHALGHSNKYATISRNATELVTFRYDVKPSVALQLVLNYL